MDLEPETSLAFWRAKPPTVDSMLGGYSQVSRTDLRGSAAFYAKLCRLHSSPVNSLVGADCGAGIGRVTAGFLSTICSTVDCVEPVASFAEQIRQQRLEGNACIGEVYIRGLAEWAPTVDKYDLIWNQWCCLYLNDEQLVEYLRRCGRAIRNPHGWIVVKENTVAGQSGDIYDKDDSSVTRSNEKYLSLFRQAGLQVYANELQRGFAKSLGLFPVRMYALRPDLTNIVPR